MHIFIKKIIDCRGATYVFYLIKMTTLKRLKVMTQIFPKFFSGKRPIKGSVTNFARRK